MDTPEIQIDYTWLWRLLKRYWIMILGITLLCGGAGLLKSQGKKEVQAQPQYIAGVQVLVNRTENSSDTENPAKIVGTYRDLVYNDGVLSDAVKLLNRKNIVNVNTAELHGAITVISRKKSQVFTLSAQADSEKKAEYFVTSVAQAFQKKSKNLVTGYEVEVLDKKPWLTSSAPEEAREEGGLKWIVLGLAGGFIISFGLAFILEMTDKKIRSSRAVDKLGLAELGHLNLTAGKGNDTAEDYRVVQANIDLTNTGKSLLVTAPVSNIGQTDLALNLGRLWAKKGKRVLLVDANLRQPQLTQLLGVDGDYGLNELFAITEAGTPAPVATATANLSLLPAGHALAAEQESKLDIAELKQLLGELAEQFDHIIVAGPALLTDASVREWAACVAGTVVVVKNNQTTIDDLNETMAALKLAKANVLGYVMNKGK